MTQILVIDDDPAMLEFLERSLKPQGYDVVIADNGLDGWEKAQRLKPALIVCDWMMPNLNGIEVCKRVKETPALSTTFFLLFTSITAIEDRIKGLDAGADDFLCKPVDVFELQARVRACLRLHQLSEDLRNQKQELQKQTEYLESEFSEAGEYVKSVLPEPLETPYFKIHSRFLPSRRLGGDGFNYYALDSEHIVIYLLDVSGHGLRAAFPSLSVLRMLNSHSLQDVNFFQPLQVLHGLNRSFQMTLRNDKYFTIWYGVYNFKKHYLVYSSAGHPPAMLLTHQAGTPPQLERLKTPGFPVGMFPGANYRNSEHHIKAPASLLLFSDGIYEFDTENGEIFGLEAFAQLLKEYYQQTNKNLDDLLQVVLNRNPEGEFNDDVSIVQLDFF